MGLSHTDDSRVGVPGVGRARRRPLRGSESRSFCWWRSCLQFVKNTPEKSHGRRRGCVHLFPIGEDSLSATVCRAWVGTGAGRGWGRGHPALALQACGTPSAVGRGVCPGARLAFPVRGKPRPACPASSGLHPTLSASEPLSGLRGQLRGVPSAAPRPPGR